MWGGGGGIWKIQRVGLIEDLGYFPILRMSQNRIYIEQVMRFALQDS